MAKKIPVTLRAVMARINRALAGDGEIMRAMRPRWRDKYGEYVTVDVQRNSIIRVDVDPETFARELGVRHDYEQVQS